MSSPAYSERKAASSRRPYNDRLHGGLITSTLLTLLVVPAVYRWFAPDATTE